jgi:hypothetical protein
MRTFLPTFKAASCTGGVGMALPVTVDPPSPLTMAQIHEDKKILL